MRTLQYNIGAGWVDVALDQPFQIAGLTNGVAVPVRVRVIDDGVISRPSLSVSGTPTDQLSISLLSVNQGNNQAFGTYSATGSILTLEYSVSNGSWQGIPLANPAVIPYANSLPTGSVRLRIGNGSAFATSGSMTISSSSRENYGVFLALNENLQSSSGNTNLSYSIDKTSTEKLIIDQIGGWANGVRPLMGGNLLRDHEGHLRFYYANRIFDKPGATYLERTGHAVGYALSTDNGATWTRPALNLTGNPINNVSSNLLSIYDTISASYITDFYSVPIYTPDGPVADRYKMLLQDFPSGGDISIATSGDGNSFTIKNRGCITRAKTDTDVILTYDPNRSLPWMILGRRRGGGIPAAGPPNPVLDRRNIVIHRTASWEDKPWSTQNSLIIDSAVEFGYVDTPLGETPLLKRDLYQGGAQFYEGQYIGFFSAFDRHDERLPIHSTAVGFTEQNRIRSRTDRTTGPIVPVLGWSRNATAWDFPDPDSEFFNMDAYKRVSLNPDRTSSANELPQTFAGYTALVIGDDMWVSAGVREDTHYEQWNGGTAAGSWEKDWFIAVHSKKRDRFFKWHPTNTAVEAVFRSSIVRIQSDATQFQINCEITGSLQVELLNAITGDPITGYAKADCDAVSDASLYNNVTWGGKTVAPLSGQNVRVKIYMTNAEFYAWKF